MDLLEIDVVYKRGTRTFLYTFFVYGWWLSLIGIGLGYLSYALYWGPLAAWASRILGRYPDLYITNGMVALWIGLTSFCFFFVAVLRAHVEYRQFKFSLDEHSFRIQKGLFRIREYTFPYNQVANVHIEQPYHWRALGLASVDIVSASDVFDTSYKKKKGDYLIPVMDKRIAKQLRSQILRYGSGERSPYEDMYPDEVYEEEEYDDYDEESGTDDESEAPSTTR